ncbi:MAG TPA: NADH-quinone oxidoreductase subunit K [Gemmatimonadaceae bacterium]|nr:NADH-quinone oxidoreductase subunit K [Gemmatimonadaceae bacterium]
MESVLVVIVGALFASGTYLLLRPNLLRLIIGLMLLGNAVNLLIFTAGRLTPGLPPIVPPGADAPLHPVANPLPQALILTAIVISLGLVAFALALLHRGHSILGTMHPDLASDESVDEQAAPADGALPAQTIQMEARRR